MTTKPLPAVPKPFDMTDLAYANIRACAPEQRAAIEAVVGTPAKAWELYRASGRAGAPAPGEDLRAALVGGMWLVFKETAELLLLSDLISERAFRDQGIKVRPVEAIGQASPIPQDDHTPAGAA